MLVNLPVVRMSRHLERLHAYVQGGVSAENVPASYKLHAQQQCRYARARAGAPPNFHKRAVNDRRVPGAPRTVIRNATLFDGERILPHHDVFLSDGLIQFVEPTNLQVPVPRDTETDHIDAAGRWFTPSIIDLHTHLGVFGMPVLPTHMDGNSRQSPVRPMVRSIDGFNEHDLSLQSTLAGGITTVLVLPGSLNNIGGHAVPIKLGSLAGRAPSSRVIDSPRALTMPGEANVDDRDDMYKAASGMHRPDASTSFRHMKMACGENALKYNLVRMDEAWNFRASFEKAQQLREKQDDFCTALDLGLLDHAPPEALRFPNDLELDILVDVLRGRTKVHTHCYTMNDLDSFVRHANEFGFPIAAFHHAHETYLVPSLLHAAPGGAPAVAIFSTNAYYKYESYFGTPFLADLLKAHNITPIFKSDHPVTDSRRLVNQAAQAHHYGLDALDALRGVTSEPARVLGLDYRVGYIGPRMDADVVLWDRHPLQLGATPVVVYVDGVSQLSQHSSTEHESGADIHGRKPASAPPSADFSYERMRVLNATDAIVQSATPPFPEPIAHTSSVVLTNVSRIFQRKNGTIQTLDLARGSLVYDDGKITCIGARPSDCATHVPAHAHQVDLYGGMILPGLTAYGSTLGLSDIPGETDASSGDDVSMLTHHLRPDLARPVPRAEDSLMFDGHALLRAHASGVTTAVSAPAVHGMFGGVSAHFDTGAHSVLDKLSVRASDVALHVSLTPPSSSFSSDGRDDTGYTASMATQLALLRSMISEPTTMEWRRVANGEWPLVVKADAYGTVAKLILLKRAFPQVRLVIDSAGALHGVAAQLAEANISVLMPAKVWMYSWEQRHRLMGPPLTRDTELGVLLRHGVQVGIRIQEAWEAANLLWDTVWAAQEAHMGSASDILALVTTKYV